MTWSEPAQAVENPFLILSRNIAVIFTHRILPTLPQGRSSARSAVQTKQAENALARSEPRDGRENGACSGPPSPPVPPPSTAAGVGGVCACACPPRPRCQPPLPSPGSAPAAPRTLPPTSAPRVRGALPSQFAIAAVLFTPGEADSK